MIPDPKQMKAWVRIPASPPPRFLTPQRNTRHEFFAYLCVFPSCQEEAPIFPDLTLIQSVLRKDLEMSELEVDGVPLRRRSTPYDFVVRISSQNSTLEVYKGRSYQYALGAYWQGVSTLRFLRASGTVQMELTKERQPFGSFRTEVEAGRLTVLHHAFGKCAEWTSRHWIEGHIAEKIMSVIPGTLGLPREPQ